MIVALCFSAPIAMLLYLALPVAIPDHGAIPEAAFAAGLALCAVMMGALLALTIFRGR